MSRQPLSGPHILTPLTHSVFARIVDQDKGGHFSITPTWEFRTKQQYMPMSNVLSTKFLNEKGIALLTGEFNPTGLKRIGAQ